MHAYYLPRHVFVCRCSDGLVFLDLRRNRYFGFGADNLSAILTLVFGWPCDGETGTSAGVLEGQAVQFAAELLKSGLVTPQADAGKEARPLQIEPPCLTSLDWEVDDPLPIASVHTWHLLRAAATMGSYLKLGALFSAVERLRRRCGGNTAVGFDVKRAGPLLNLFRRARPLLFTSQRKCLFDSFALAEFLARYDLRPTVVIGVATRPFRAHCWVQQGAAVLNDEVERVSEYTPILGA